MTKHVTMKKALVERPGDVGIDLPPGATAKELSPADYHLLEMEPAEKPSSRRPIRKATPSRRERR